ncbi:hypothetical protein WMY93_028979 [Mugilogobius chulae]|uniref:Thrombopoietin n=1 Tax=Mugilogobius chulae TaxID=88201 RepID=A0AAW0MTB5_9GOBI
MAHSSFLLRLLLMGVLSCLLPEAEARPVDFWCQPQIRAGWRASAVDMTDRMIDCQGEVAGPATQIQCPFVGINRLRWDNLTAIEKLSEVVSDLQVLQHGLEETHNQTVLNCQPLLKDITHHVKNSRIILQRSLQNATMEASLSPPQTCSGLSAALKRYEKLLQGKLELSVSGLCNKNTTDFISTGL